MDMTNRRKVDPRLRELQEGYEPVFIELRSTAAAEWLKSQRGVRHVVHLIDGYYTASVERPRILDLAQAPAVIEIEGVRYFRPHLHHSVESIGGRAHTGPEGLPGEGKGVVIGVIDYGLDVTLQDFQNPVGGAVKDAHNPNGITRVAYLWDQDLTPEPGEHTPSKYDYGVEYSSDQIDGALKYGDFERIRHNPLNAETSIQGHGTHVTGIAAGNGETHDDQFAVGKYVGVAPAATIIFVNLKRSDIRDQVDSPAGTLGNSVNLAHAIAYCYEKADALQMPCVLNLSMGFNGGGHDGNMAVEWVIDALLQKSGRALVFAAGNEDGTKNSVHAAAVVAEGKDAQLDWEIGYPEDLRFDDKSPNELEVWYPAGGDVRVELVAPDSEPSGEVAPDESRTFEFSQGEKVTFESDSATPWSGAARVHIHLEKNRREKGIRFGTWQLKLHAKAVAGADGAGRMTCDAWIERTLPTDSPLSELSRFAQKHYDEKRAVTVTTPGTGRRSISVAGYENDPESNNPPICWYSGCGPTRDGRAKPEIAAPGDPVWSSNAKGGRADAEGNMHPARRKWGGTSMAAPHVAGVIARMLSRNAFLTAREIREILVATAVPPNGGAAEKWHPKWGYGKVDAARAVERVEQLVGSRITDEQG